MVKHNGAIKYELLKLWPKCMRPLLLDRHYYVLTLEQLTELVKINSVKHRTYIPEVNDCDDFGLQLLAKMRAYQIDCLTCHKPKRPHYSWAIGECMVTKYHGVVNMHFINIAYCKEGVYLIEPQSDRIWKASPDQDDVVFIRF